MTVMEHQNLLNMFSLKCVDEMTTNDFAKIGLTCVPTLVLINPQNGNKKIYEKTEVFEWVDSVLENRRQNIIRSAENNRKLVEINEMKKRMADGLSANCQSEMQGISDQYSYWKDDIAQDIDIAHPKNFVPALSIGNDMYKIHTIPQTEKIEKLNKIDQKNLIDNLASARKAEDSKLKGIMEQQQINKVLNS